MDTAELGRVELNGAVSSAKGGQLGNGDVSGESGILVGGGAGLVCIAFYLPPLAAVHVKKLVCVVAKRKLRDGSVEAPPELLQLSGGGR